MPNSEGERIGAVVLAAGRSRRLGPAKLLLPFGDSTVIGCVVEALAGPGLDPIVVVAGEHHDSLTEVLRDTRAQVVSNPDPDRGMLSSVRIGVGALPPDLDRFLISLGDLPRLRAAHVSHLLREQRRAGKGIAIATHAGKRGHPVVFDAGYREVVLALDDGLTLRDLIHSHAEDVVAVECDSDAVISDIDTREDYERELRAALAEQ